MICSCLKKTADDILDNLGINDPLLEIALTLEDKGLADDYFVECKLYPNVDFYTGVIYREMGFPTKMLPCSSRWPGYRAGSRTGAR